MNILINALGIQDSGGIRVLKKALKDCSKDRNYKYTIACYDNQNINILYNKYKHVSHFHFIFIPEKSFLYRLYYENIVFKKIIKKKSIKLIYNFSGSSQIFLKTPKLIKIQNLLFYSKKLDTFYVKNNQFILWLRQIYLKRIVFKTMVNKSTYIEIQSSHVKTYLSDFIDTKNKQFFIKSDIDVDNKLFSKPKKYDFENKIKFLYIVGPHFEYLHKNFIDFVNAMIELKNQNIDFEINITLTKKQLNTSNMWQHSLDKLTNFLGYINNKEEMDKLFCSDTILISTSIIETLGLHVIEAIKNGIVPVVPDEEYSYAVYGKNIIAYELCNTKSLLNSIFSIMDGKVDIEQYILTLQNDLQANEKKKMNSIVEIFKKVDEIEYARI